MRSKTSNKLINNNFVILECEYDDSHLDWEIVKKEIIKRYSKKYTDYCNFRVYREKTDTKGLRCWTLWGQKR